MSLPVVNTLILGAGMAGLSTAYHLRSDHLVLERASEPGGLSRSVESDGFTFDHTGHLLHLRHPYTLALIPQLLGDNLLLHERRAMIYSHGVYTRYPFQANTYGLPKATIRECLQGLVEAQCRYPSSSALSFRDWVLRTFGRGFAKHFFFPYNEKMWMIPLSTLTAEWVAPFVPRPKVGETIEGAFLDQTKKFGYNATFYYPKKGGIQALAKAFAEQGPRIRYKCEISRLNLKQQWVELLGGERFRYRFLVTTLPLPQLIHMIEEAPDVIRRAPSLLRWTAVYDLNLGIERPSISRYHWIYFPEKKFRFYRVGFPMNFSMETVPPGCSSMYVEVACPPGRPLNERRILKDCLEGLYACRILKRSDKIRTVKPLLIRIAYVIFDEHRTPATQLILNYLKEHQVFSMGRFGGWKYSYMEEAILEGKATAEMIDGISR